MKQPAKAVTYKAIVTIFLLNILQRITFAQESSISASQTTTVTETHAWYMQPWAWVMGGVVLLLLIISLVRSNSSSGNTTTDKVTYTKTTEKGNS